MSVIKYQYLEKHYPRLIFTLASLKNCHKRALCRALHSFPQPRRDVTAFYSIGVGDAAWQRAIVKWLRANRARRFYLIIDDLQIVDQVIEPLFMHQQTKMSEQLTEMSIEHPYEKWQIVGATLAEEKLLERSIMENEGRFSLYRDCGRKIIRNSVVNRSLPDIHNGERLKKLFRGIPAVVCGAGPSLDQAVGQLRKWGQNGGVIFGCGSALAALAAEKVPLDFLVMLDPNHPYERFLSHSYFNTPLLFQDQLDHRIVQIHHGAKFSFGGSAHLSLLDWLLEGEIQGGHNVGWTVGTYGIFLADFLGCSPIYLVGMDLSVREDQEYASSIEKFSRQSIRKKNPIIYPNSGEHPLFTRDDFILSKKWIEEFASNESKQLIPVGKGGVLEGCLPDALPKPFNKDKSRLFDLLSTWPPLSPVMVREKWGCLSKSVNNTLGLLTEYKNKLCLGRDDRLIKIELEEEVFYDLYLQEMWGLWKRPIEKQQDDLLANRKQKDPVSKKIGEVVFYLEITKKFQQEILSEFTSL